MVGVVKMLDSIYKFIRCNIFHDHEYEHINKEDSCGNKTETIKCKNCMKILIVRNYNKHGHLNYINYWWD